MNDFTLENARQALAYIPAQDRDLWCRTGMALKSRFGEAGYAAFEEWSMTSSNYEPASAKSTWKSFNADGGITIGTLIFEAQERGFKFDGHTRQISAADLEHIKQERETDASKAEAERADRQNQASRDSSALWGQMQVAGPHSYLDAKCVKPNGLRSYLGSLSIGGMAIDGALGVPLRNSHGKIRSLQFISETGEKRFLPGGQKTACYFAIGRPSGKILICEGFATGATLHEITGHAVAVAFDCGNLLSVATTLRAKYPEAELVIAGDNDRATKINAGITAATKAAIAVGAKLAIPDFPAESRGSDFNDLARECGEDAVASIIAGAHIPRENALLVQNVHLVRGWDQIIPLGEAGDSPPLSADCLPAWLRSYVEAVSRSTQTPMAMPLMSALSVLATAAQKKFVVRPYGDDYYEPLNIWTVTAMPPASRKSAVSAAFNDVFSEWERSEFENTRHEINQQNVERTVGLARIEKLKRDAANSNDEQERNDLIRQVTDAQDKLADEARPPRLFTNDVTPERLQQLLAENKECMAVLSDEGGLFEIMGGLYSDGRANLDVFLKGHAGTALRVDRGSRVAHMDNPALTLGLVVQPQVIADLNQGSKRRFRGTGMLARFLYAMPTSNVGQRDIRTRESVPIALSLEYEKNIRGLLTIERRIGEDGTQTPISLSLDSGAFQKWLAFSQFIESRQGPGGDLEQISDWSGKLPGAALRIAGLCHVAGHQDRSFVISSETMEKVLDLCGSLVQHAQAAFAVMGEDETIADAIAVQRWILEQAKPEFFKTACYNGLRRRIKNAKRLSGALELLAERNIISNPLGLPTPGKTTYYYKVNPAALAGGKQ